MMQHLGECLGLMGSTGAGLLSSDLGKLQSPSAFTAAAMAAVCASAWLSRQATLRCWNGSQLGTLFQQAALPLCSHTTRQNGQDDVPVTQQFQRKCKKGRPDHRYKGFNGANTNAAFNHNIIYLILLSPLLPLSVQSTLCVPLASVLTCIISLGYSLDKFVDMHQRSGCSLGYIMLSPCISLDVHHQSWLHYALGYISVRVAVWTCISLGYILLSPLSPLAVQCADSVWVLKV
jgi:hypothetical protein